MMVLMELIDAKGWVHGASRVPSPNFDARPAGCEISLIVVHAISLPPEQYGSDDIAALFTNTLDPNAHPYFAGIHELRVSAHFLIRRDGALVQFVATEDRAWHAGVSSWQGRERCNDFSIGIELEGDDHHPFESAQYTTLNTLIALLVELHPIDAVVGHQHIAPSRKTDPGPFFTWSKISAANFSRKIFVVSDTKITE